MRFKMQLEFLGHWAGFEIGLGAGAMAEEESKESTNDAQEDTPTKTRHFKTGFQPPDADDSD